MRFVVLVLLLIVFISPVSGLPTYYYLGNGTGSGTNNNGYIYYGCKVLNTTGTVSQMIINVSAANGGNGRIALFSSNNELPYQLLSESASTALNDGETIITVPTVSVTSGIKYCSADQFSSGSTDEYFASTGGQGYEAHAYGTFPATAGAPTGNSGFNMMILVEPATPTPSPTPIPQNASNNISIINSVCSNATNIGTSCIFVYASDYILIEMTIITVCILFITLYIFYKEVVK